MRCHENLPFDMDDIEAIYQTDGDKNPRLRSDWYFWDRW